MSTTASHETIAHADPVYRVVATLGWPMLPRVRAALAQLRVSRVLVSAAQSWSEGEIELSYRGQRIRCDRKVARVEIACAEQQVYWIVKAIDGILASTGSSGRAQGSIVAFSVSAARADMPALALDAIE